jgi:phosphatidylglycerol:prolipoprotein diacylglycerol transferase
MLIHPQFDPVAIRLGPLAVHWYGIMYLVAFALFMVLARLRLKHEPYATEVALHRWSMQDVEDLLFYGVMGVVVGGRLGYCLFYKPDYYFHNPLEIFAVWQGGMSFHGGMLGVFVAMTVFAWRFKRPWFWVTDFIAPCVPTGLASGRLGNFINGELWGRACDPSLPWGVVFPQSSNPMPRHPSQIYQFLGEGLLLFVILWLFARKPRPVGAVSGVFMIGYGSFRFAAEYFREPDSFLGLLSLGLSMGQWLCVPMIIAGALILRWAYRQQPDAQTTA